jgi:hypothetical protein
MDGAVFAVRRHARPREGVAWWAAVALAALTLALIASTIPLADAAGLHSTVGAGFLAVLVAFVAVGLMLVGSRPRNLIGWSMLGAAFFGGVTGVAGPYAVDSYRLHHHLPLAPVAVLLQPAWAPAIFLIALSIMLFPDGELPSGRWRWPVGGLAVVAGVWMIGAFAIAVEAIALHQVVVEPTGDLYRIDHPTSAWVWWSVAQVMFFVGLLSIGLLWLVSRVPAYRKSTGERRQQLKWLIFGGSIACLGGVLSVFLSSFSGLLGTIGSLAIVGVLGVPISVGIGITKYRLYEIDRLVSRTLSYSLLTGALVALFAGLVLLTTRVLPFSSPVGVAASTLAIAAVFTPLRSRLQRLVDRRFNRGRYDAEALVATFGVGLRNAADLDAIRQDLLETASHAVQPMHITVWLADDQTR